MAFYQQLFQNMGFGFLSVGLLLHGITLRKREE
jgi:hypothetical protein